jgi:hypothetical protein
VRIAATRYGESVTVVGDGVDRFARARWHGHVDRRVSVLVGRDAYAVDRDHDVCDGLMARIDHVNADDARIVRRSERERDVYLLSLADVGFARARICARRA